MDELVNAEKDRVNLYGAILDCSAPYYMDKTGKYLCTVKLIDETINPDVKNKAAPENLSVTFFSKTAADLPQATKIGSILRIHRGQSKKFKDKFQLNCDVGIKGSWVLFDPIDGNTPVAKSGKRCTYSEKDKAHLVSIRKFIKAYFGKQELAGITFKEAEKKKPKDFDVLCYVLDVKHKGIIDRVRLCDETQVVKLDLPDNRKGYLSPFEVIRIRSADFKKSGELTLSEYSNILRVPKEYLSAKELLKSLKKDKLPADVKDNLALYNPEAEVATKLVGSHKSAKVTSLKTIFGEKLPKGEKQFRVRVNVVEVGPKDPHDWICVLNKKEQ